MIMSRSSLALFAILTFSVASQARADESLLPDASGRLARADHVQSCERNKWACSQQFGPSSEVLHELAHCRIKYEQCLNRGDGASTFH